MESAGQWLEGAILELCKKVENGLNLDADIISGLVSYCDLASPLDAKEYLDNIIGQEAGKFVTEEYLKRRGQLDVYKDVQDAPSSQLHAYVKPPSNDGQLSGSRKPQRESKQTAASTGTQNQTTSEASGSRGAQKGNQGGSKKKKSGKVVSLSEAAKGSYVFQQGKPCSCQARRHRLVSNCLSCGKIVCEQEGEGPCSYCGSLVLREGSSYAGLEGVVSLTDTEAAAEAFAKRLVDYDRNSAARTTVIDDQGDYYNVEDNTWLSTEEKELLRKKREEIEEEERAKRNRVVMTFDLVGRKVLLNEDEASEGSHNRTMFQPAEVKEAIRFKPNPTSKIQPVFVDPGPRKNVEENLNRYKNNGICLEISGRVQHDSTEVTVL
ncbi:transcription cofactor [Lithospermum erythrorhizon]|uniref:Transcription cofactor n=1 Tax=Lithospermum erythrorhizon TaxID=34254 RepID=A0AAV3NXT4_LITER